MEKLTSNEQIVASDIVRKGLLKAAESLSFFMQEDLGIKELNFELNEILEYPIKTGNNIHLLTTEVIGDVKGICYLVFSEEEANKLREIALSVEIKNNPELAAVMNDAIMLEVDNIISASVITELSNLLKHKIYGGVPDLKLVNELELKELMNSNLEKDMYIINFKTKFTSTDFDFSPEFVWFFDSKFMTSIKEYASNQANLQLQN